MPRVTVWFYSEELLRIVCAVLGPENGVSSEHNSYVWVYQCWKVFLKTKNWKQEQHGPLTRYLKLQVTHAPGMPRTFSPRLRVSYPDMHHGTCEFRDACRDRLRAVSFKVGGGENPCSFTYLVRGPCFLKRCYDQIVNHLHVKKCICYIEFQRGWITFRHGDVKRVTCFVSLANCFLMYTVYSLLYEVNYISVIDMIFHGTLESFRRQPADEPEPHGVRASAGTVIIRFMPHICYFINFTCHHIV